VEEMGEKSANGCDSEAIFKSGKPSSITFNVGAPTFFGGSPGNPACALLPDG
jgi:hypothetical protein